MLTKMEQCLISQALSKTLDSNITVLHNETGVDINRLIDNIDCINERIKAFNKYEKFHRKSKGYFLETL